MEVLIIALLWFLVLSVFRPADKERRHEVVRQREGGRYRW